MKYIIATVSCFLVLIASVFSQSLNRRQEIIVADYGPNNSQTIADVLTGTAGREITLVFNRGTWPITNAHNVSSNYVLSFEPGSEWDVPSNITCAWDNCGIDAGHYAIFQGAGAITGSFNGTFRVPEWGATGSLRIGNGALPELTTNDYQENGGVILTTTGSGGLLTNVPAGFLKGADVSYSTTTSVTVNVGQGYNMTNYFAITSPITHVVSSLAAGTNFHYIYLDDDASTYPNTIATIDSATEPVYNTNYFGWYNGDDRCVGAVFSTNTQIARFDQSDDWQVLWYWSMLTTNMNPDNTWQIPGEGGSATNELSEFIPVNSFEATLWFAIFDIGSTPYGVVALKETADVITNQIWNTGVVYNELYGNILPAYPISSATDGGPYTVRLGASRKIRIQQQDDDDNTTQIGVLGWRIIR